MLIRTRILRIVSLAAAVALLLTLTSTSRADLPPPDGTKFISFGFGIDAQSKTPGMVLLAYPYSTSDGAPTTEFAELKPGQAVSLGRRGGTPFIYAVPEALYRRWKKEHRPRDLDDVSKEFQVLQDSGKLVRCNLRPTPTTTLPSDDPRKEIIQTFGTVEVSASRCVLRDSSTAAPQNQPKALPTAAKSSGCTGCTMATSQQPKRLGYALTLAAALWLQRRRRRIALRHPAKG